MTKKDFFKSSFVLLGAGLMGFTSCTNEDENIVTPDKKGLVSIEIRGGINDGRTHLNGDGKTVEFDSNDELAVWDGVAKREFKTDAGGSVAVFKGEIAENASQLNILYPFSAGKYCDGTTITATIPATQTATAGTFDPKANLSVATADYTKGQNITCTLQNVCGLLKFTIANDALEDSYDSIRIAGKNGEKIAGTVTITNKQIDADSGDATIVTLGDATKKLKKDSTYYVALKPGTYASGLTLTFYRGGAQVGEPMTLKNSEGKVEIKTGVILNAKEVKPEPLYGPFTVNSAGTKVKFAPGNLYWDGSKFKFETNQWDYPTFWNANHVGHFYWSKTASVTYAQSYSDSGTSTNDVFFTNGTETTAKSDFTVDNNGTEETGKWRTLSSGEWNYLLNSRSMATVSFHHTNCSGGVSIGDTTYYGLFIYPDGYSGSQIGSGGPSTWDDINSAGIVFLPCVGFRMNASMKDVSEGAYSSSVAYSSTYAQLLSFTASYVNPAEDFPRYFGLSVRLVSVLP